MRVSTVSARVKASKEVNGCWKTIEFGAEGILESGDDWKKSQDQLVADLTGQLKKAFSHRDPEGHPNGQKPDYPEPPIPSHRDPEGKDTKTEKKGNPRKKANPGKPKTKMCPIHNVPMKRWTNDNGGSWYSHNDETTGGEWCSGKKSKRKAK